MQHSFISRHSSAFLWQCCPKIAVLYRHRVTSESNSAFYNKWCDQRRLPPHRRGTHGRDSRLAHWRNFFIERHEKYPSKSMTVRQNFVKRMHGLRDSFLSLSVVSTSRSFFTFTDQREACHFRRQGKKSSFRQACPISAGIMSEPRFFFLFLQVHDEKWTIFGVFHNVAIKPTRICRQ